MSRITVKTMLAVILENNMQMDDEICFGLTPETHEVLGTYYDIELASTEVWRIQDDKLKTLAFMFDLNDVTEEE